MKNILLPRYRKFLSEFLRARPLLVFDFDGTLSPIVSRPAQVRVRVRTREFLNELSKFYPIAILSGRSRLDVRAQAHGLGARTWVGNHGSDWGRRDSESNHWRLQVRPWLPVLRSALEKEPGMTIEDKGMSVSLHYRHSPCPQRARRLALRVVDTLPGVRVVGGKQVLNLVPDGAPDKGTALLRLMEREKRSHALFVGDDLTDEDGFREARRDPRILGVKIGLSQNSDARYGVCDQASVDLFLREIRDLSRSSRRSGVK